MATHAGMSTDEFGRIVEDWIATARHPDSGRLFTEMVYQPMLELLAYLCANGFRNYIVTGGGIEFVRQWGERVYGVTPEQVIGSSIKTRFELRDGKPVLMRLPHLNFNNDKAGKPVTIHQHIGRAPLAAFGNSVGDQQMLEYTLGGDGARFGLLVLHDDAAREYAYGPVLGMATPQLGAFTPALYEQAKTRRLDRRQHEERLEAGLSVRARPGHRDQHPAGARRHDASACRSQQRPAAARCSREGFALDATHRPHVTLFSVSFARRTSTRSTPQRARCWPASMCRGLRMEAFKYYYIPSGNIGLAGIVARPSPELRELQRALIDAVAPFTVATGGSAAFATTPDDPVIDPLLIGYVSAFVQKSAGEQFSPHVTTGIAPREYLDKMLAEPFEPFMFSPAGAAVYQLGQFGTAARKLHGFALTR